MNDNNTGDDDTSSTEQCPECERDDVSETGIAFVTFVVDGVEKCYCPECGKHLADIHTGVWGSGDRYDDTEPDQ